MKFHLLRKLCAIIACGLPLLCTYGHNGSVAYAYPMKTIEVDADLSDWPVDLKKYPIAYYQYGFKPESKDDISGYFVIGYNKELQEIYVGVEMIDDSYIRNEENPQYWAHDMQVLYIDPQHKKESTGVFALEVNEYFRKIVDQEMNWDPFVLDASWNMVDVKAKRYEDRTVYEWKLKLKGYIEEGRTIGFDYVVFDKDSPDSNTNTVGWGRDEGVKHECSKCLGDIVLMSDKTELTEISGRVISDRDTVMPRAVNLDLVQRQGEFISLAVDSLGAYQGRVPVGEYQINISSGLLELENDFVRLSGADIEKVNLLADRTNKAPTTHVGIQEVPDLIPSKGILHNFDDSAARQLDRIVESYREYYGIPGVSLALIKDGKLFLHKTYGYKNLSKKDKVDDETLFEAASITKPVFAYVVLRLAERNIIDLDKPLAEYLAFEDLEEYPEYKKMTGRHVLTHRTGLPNWGREMQSEPGEKFGYSGEGFEYLKRVVSKITDKEIDAVVAEELIRPLSIGHMQFRDTLDLAAVVASGHINETPTVRFLPKEAGMAWSMYTEAKDFSIFALNLLDRKGLKAETYKELMTIHSKYPEDWKVNKKYEEGMGLGISLRNTDYGKVFGHGGNNGDFKCLFEIYEDLGMGFIIYTNSNTGDALNDVMAQILIEGKRVPETSMSEGEK